MRVTPDMAFVGREMTADDAILKLVDERTCLFRSDFRWFRLRRSPGAFPLYGEITFGHDGYLVVGRLPYSILVAYLLFVGGLIYGVAETQQGSEPGIQFLLAPLAILIFTTAVLSISVDYERDRMNSIYPRVVDRLLSKT
jgi:hypothetical protein